MECLLWLLHSVLYHKVADASLSILGCLALHACDDPHLCWLKGLLRALVYHTLSCHQDAMLAEQSPTASQLPRCGLF